MGYETGLKLLGSTVVCATVQGVARVCVCVIKGKQTQVNKVEPRQLSS